MGALAHRFLDSILRHGGREMHRAVIGALGDLDADASPGRQSQYLSDALSMVNGEYGPEMVSRIMRPCGRECIPEWLLANARRMYDESEGLDGFLRLLNEQGIGGGSLSHETGRITALYHRCYCDLAQAAESMTPLFCHCSAGWFERLFSETLGHAVETRILRSILGGSDQCLFEITLQE